MFTPAFAQGLGVTALTIGCMFVGFYFQDGMLRSRMHSFAQRVESATELALQAKEQRVQALEKRAAGLQQR